MMVLITAIAFTVIYGAVIGVLTAKLKRATALMKIYKEVADEYMEKTLLEVMGAISDPKYYQGRAEKQEERT